MLSNCTKMTMKELLSSLALQNSTATISVVYPNLSKLAQVFMALPIGTADCERGFSTMKRIKTCLRSQMSNVALNAHIHGRPQLLTPLILTLLLIHGQHSKNEELFNLFVTQKCIAVIFFFLLCYVSTSLYLSAIGIYVMYLLEKKQNLGFLYF